MRASANLVPRTRIPGFLDSWDRGGAHRTSGAVRLLGRPAVRGRAAVTASHAGPADAGRYSGAGLATSNRIITTRTGRAGARQGRCPKWSANFDVPGDHSPVPETAEVLMNSSPGLEGLSLGCHAEFKDGSGREWGFCSRC